MAKTYKSKDGKRRRRVKTEKYRIILINKELAFVGKRCCPRCLKIYRLTDQHWTRHKSRSNGFACLCRHCKHEEGKETWENTPPEVKRQRWQSSNATGAQRTRRWREKKRREKLEGIAKLVKASKGEQETV